MDSANCDVFLTKKEKKKKNQRRRKNQNLSAAIKHTPQLVSVVTFLPITLLEALRHLFHVITAPQKHLDLVFTDQEETFMSASFRFIL